MGSESNEKCKGKLEIQDGSWVFKPDDSAECTGALESMLEAMGPAGVCYVSNHIEPANDQQKQLVEKAKQSC